MQGKEKAPPWHVRQCHDQWQPLQGSVAPQHRTAGGETINVTVPSSQGKFVEGNKIILHWPKEALHIMAGEA
jgi:hypothetical protein